MTRRFRIFALGIVALGLSGVVAARVNQARADEPRRMLLVGQGPDGHPRTTHEFMAGVRVMKALLEKVPDLEITTSKAEEPWLEGPELLARADAAVLFVSQGAQWMQASPRRYQALAKLADRGGGLVALHWAVGAKEAKYLPGYLRLLGAAHGGEDRKYQKLETKVTLADPEHPITRGIEPFRVYDEFYYQLKLQEPASAIRPLLLAEIDGTPEMAAWCWERPDAGRSFGFVGLHFHDNWRRTEYRRLVAQAILWTLKLPVPDGGFDVAIDNATLSLPAADKATVESR